MTDPATTIREYFSDLGLEFDHPALAALTELEQQLAKATVDRDRWAGEVEVSRRERDQYKREFDKVMDNALNATERYTAAERERDQLADTLRAVAWKDSAGLCWCPGETEFAVAHPNGEHTPRCLAARAALDRHTQP